MTKPLLSALSSALRGPLGRSIRRGGVDPLARWKALGNGPRVMPIWGDSTTILAQHMWDCINDELVKPFGELEGATVINMGSNGQTLAGANAQEGPAIYATNPNLVVSNFGINDVRLGGVSVAELMSRLATNVELLQTNVPNSDILLWTPNALASTDETGLYIQPIEQAQAYTDIMWNAYNNTRGNVAHADKQAMTGRVCVPEPGPWMTDALHPNAFGQIQNLRGLIPVIAYVPPPIDKTASAAAWASNPTNPWTVYPRALEDTRYCTLIRKIRIDGYFDLSGTLLMYLMQPRLDPDPVLDPTTFHLNDLIQTPTGVYVIDNPDNFSVYNVNSVQAYGMATAAFPATEKNTNMRHYRINP